jgi:hypothetical protein
MSSIIKVDTIQDQAGNNIINESSDTITIGASGDTVNIVGTLQNNGSAVEVDSVTFKEGGTNFTNSLLVGTSSTGTLDAAQNNTGVGLGVFAALTSGDGNTAVGTNSLDANTTGANNVAVGFNSMSSNTTGSD